MKQSRTVEGGVLGFDQMARSAVISPPAAPTFVDRSFSHVRLAHTSTGTSNAMLGPASCHLYTVCLPVPIGIDCTCQAMRRPAASMCRADTGQPPHQGPGITNRHTACLGISSCSSFREAVSNVRAIGSMREHHRPVLSLQHATARRVGEI